MVEIAQSIGGDPLASAAAGAHRRPRSDPDITTCRIRSEALLFDGQVGVWVDGVDCGTVATLDVEIVPDAAEIYV